MTRRSDARQRYLEIAARYFSERGLHGASLAAIAAEAGVTKQALLYFFRSKERLYTEVLSDLSDRLTSGIDAVDATDSASRLIKHLDMEAVTALTRPQDARLVIRALLDSDMKARVWPLRPYLTKLTGLVLDTPQWQDSSEELALAGLCQLIGSIQYFVVATPTLCGMFGDRACRDLAFNYSVRIRGVVEEFIQSGDRCR